MNDKVAVVICNYNKKDYVLKCISSVLNSSFKNYDIYVVDNVSDDNSADVIYSEYGSKVKLIINEQNIGGSGGFNTGIREALKGNYKYIYLLDNDVEIDKDALMNLYNFLEKNKDAAIAGSKIYLMDTPDCIQETGALVDMSDFNIKLLNSGVIDKDNANNSKEYLECDYVAACSMLIRTDVLRKIETIDENYFVYWDDIDLSYRAKLQGYRVCCVLNSHVWHKGGGTARSNTFGTYYFLRNRIHFFIKYLKNEQLDSFALKIFEEVFQVIYSFNYIGKYSGAKTITHAVTDALEGIRGKAPEGRIFEIENLRDKFNDAFINARNIVVFDCTEIKTIQKFLNKLSYCNENINVTIVSKNNNIDELKKRFLNVKVIQEFELNKSEYDLICMICNQHVFNMGNNLDDFVDIYIDEYFNVLSSEKDKEYAKNINFVYDLFLETVYPVFVQKVKDAHALISSKL